MRTLALVTALVALVFGGFVLVYTGLKARPPGAAGEETRAPMERTPAGGMRGREAAVPPVKGYLDGDEIYFIHTEASDPKAAKMLTDMTGSPVLTVPSLAQTPEIMLADVYVFTNGIKGDGPFGFQLDVFDSPPGTSGYSPLRAMYLVTWKDERRARVLRSVDAVKEAHANGEVWIEGTGVVVNMPFLTWPGGRR